MNQEALKALEDKLWDAANSFRASAGIKAADYALPVLGVIFLKFADNRYSQHEAAIEEEYAAHAGGRRSREKHQIAIARCGFFLPPEARYDHLLQLPGEESTAAALRAAMEAIESYLEEDHKDMLPAQVYGPIEDRDRQLLPDLLRTFADIPREADGDLFGKIYEYFLGKFALSEGQKGGEFYTPPSVVRFIVEVLQPTSGKIFDPACGSGGMFVQSAALARREDGQARDIYVCGQEYMAETARLARMNLLVNNLRGKIANTNSYEQDPFGSEGAFDFVMANPPFNVKSVKEATVKEDPRFNHYGLPRSGAKNNDSISDANYLWISLFARSLNAQGRAGFVMANSASDARNAEYEIRKNIVDSGIVDCMVAMPSNMFFTVTLPATLWFFDQAKAGTERAEQILFLDAREVYRQLDRAHRDWTPEQQRNLACIVAMYRGEGEAWARLCAEYLAAAQEAAAEAVDALGSLQEQMAAGDAALRAYLERVNKGELNPANRKKLKNSTLPGEISDYLLPGLLEPVTALSLTGSGKEEKASQPSLQALSKALDESQKARQEAAEAFAALHKEAERQLRGKEREAWKAAGLEGCGPQALAGAAAVQKAAEALAYWLENLDWLQERFPEGKYRDITGLCKVADRSEYAGEQDYSLNPGRYVGVELEVDKLSEKAFKSKVLDINSELQKLNNEANQLNLQIDMAIKGLFS